MLLGCLTYSHRLCVSRQNHNILWLLCATRTILRNQGRTGTHSVCFQEFSAITQLLTDAARNHGSAKRETVRREQASFAQQPTED
jgi:hypothetical protein